MRVLHDSALVYLHLTSVVEPVRFDTVDEGGVKTPKILTFPNSGGTCS